MSQQGILHPVPRVARHLMFDLRPGVDPRPSLERLRALSDGVEIVVGLGLGTVKRLDATVEPLHEVPPLVGPQASMPSTPAALWCWLRGSDHGDMVHLTHKVREAVTEAFDPAQTINCFQFGESRDLSGYEDGTENPQGDEAREVAFAEDGSSYVAVQRWLHDLPTFHAMDEAARDDVFGRRIKDNTENPDAPESAHVKRAEQEDYDPEANMLRRSMPWSNEDEEGLVFVAFGESLDSFDRICFRMVGLEDGITDALFTFTRPLSTSTFWCPPMTDGTLDLSKVGL